jgi:hypothetical protein
MVTRTRLNAMLHVQGGLNLTGTDLCVKKSQFVPVIFEPPYILRVL